MKYLVGIRIKRGKKSNYLPSRNFDQPRENIPHIHVCVIERSIFQQKAPSLLENSAILCVFLQGNPEQLEGNAERASMV